MGASEYGITHHFGKAIEWIADEHTDIIDFMKAEMPGKCKKNKSLWPLVLWIAPSIHDNYGADQHQKRRKFTKCLEKIAHGDRKISCLRVLQHVWNQQDNTLVEIQHGKRDAVKFTAAGWNTLWNAIDNMVKYFDEKTIPEIIAEKQNDIEIQRRQWKPKNISRENVCQIDQRIVSFGLPIKIHVED